MSIINEALKKAEHERAYLPLPALMRTEGTRIRQYWVVMIVAGLIAGTVFGGGMGIWLWVSAPPQLPPRPNQPRAAQAAIGPGQTARPSDLVPSRATVEKALHKAAQAEAEGAWDQAIRYYEEAIASNGTLWGARNALGNLYARQNQLSAAMAQFQAILAIEPQHAVARNNLGSIYLMLGHEERAAQEFLAAVRIDARYVTPYYNLGSLYARRGEVDQAVSFLTRAMALEPAVGTWLQDDSDFNRIREARAFQQLQVRAAQRR
ncbi:MAG: TPR end-of-group domain-containing protein [Candidatus Entotheonellia bacterium]